jgi:hypothetical protein
MTSFSLVQLQKLSALKSTEGQTPSFNISQNKQQPNSIFQAVGFNYNQSNATQNPFNFGDADPMNSQQQTNQTGGSNIQEMLSKLLQSLGLGKSNAVQDTSTKNNTVGVDAADNKNTEKKGIQSAKDHFERFGKKEGRTFTNEADYLKNNPDVDAAIMRGQDPPADLKDFNEEKYLAANPDVAKAVKEGTMASGLEHYKQFGTNEGRYTSPEEAQKYLQKAKDKNKTGEPTTVNTDKTTTAKTTSISLLAITATKQEETDFKHKKY